MYRLIALVLCIGLGWAMGYIRLPYIEKDHSFWIGLLGSLGFISLAILLYSMFKSSAGIKNPSRLFSTRRSSVIRTFSVLAVFCVLVWSVFIFYQNKVYKRQIETQNETLKKQAQSLDSVSQGSLMTRMNKVLERVEEEADQNEDNTLSEKSIAEIAALGSSLKPYWHYQKDSLYGKRLSPERGQLLLALSLIEMDSASFAKIKKKVSFSNAFIANGDLSNVDLSGIDLNNANLQEIDLSKANLKGANLREAFLFKATMEETNLNLADMRRANVRWAKMNNVSLEGANLDGAEFSNSIMTNANLKGANIHWSNLDGALLNNADLSGCDLRGTSMMRTNLSNAKITEASILGGDMTDATLLGLKTDSGWISNLTHWSVTGAEEVLMLYKTVTDTLDDEKLEYHLEQVSD
jgi:uncharacterized protein YjbI with pentapeptide repeats